MRLLQSRLRRLAARSEVLVAVVGFLTVVSVVFVYLGGGTKTPWPHMFYLPVVLTAATWGMRSGLVVGVAAGLLCGPFMPLDVEAGTPQTAGAWLLRTASFVLVAAVSAGSRARILDLTGARQQLLAAVSHELRTPLAAVIGFSRLVIDRHDELSDLEFREFAVLINQEATELSNVIDHYVLEAGVEHNLIVDRIEVDLRHVVDVVLLGIPADIRESRIVVTGEGVTVYGDPLRIRQIVRSLVNNALAYGGEQIFVLVSIERGYGRVLINDGRDREGIDQILSAPPLGVGLAVARELAELMDGRLSYRTTGRATFELELPAVRDASRRRSAAKLDR
jgi:signal transduction histidine kinase